MLNLTGVEKCAVSCSTGRHHWDGAVCCILFHCRVPLKWGSMLYPVPLKGMFHCLFCSISSNPREFSHKSNLGVDHGFQYVKKKSSKGDFRFHQIEPVLLLVQLTNALIYLLFPIRKNLKVSVSIFNSLITG